MSKEGQGTVTGLAAKDTMVANLISKWRFAEKSETEQLSEIVKKREQKQLNLMHLNMASCSPLWVWWRGRSVDKAA